MFLTEQEWLACADAGPMLRSLPDRSQGRVAQLLGRHKDPDRERQLCLFAIACYARVADADHFPDVRQLVTNEPADPPRTVAAPWNDEYDPELVEDWAGRWSDI